MTRAAPWTAALLFAGAARSADFVWPLSNSPTPDATNTSFGPRVDYSKWDFHDGLDLPAPDGTTCYAVRDGIVVRAGPGGTDGYSSRHLVLRTWASDGTTLYVNYVHLSGIDPSATTLGAAVVQGQRVAFVGADDATYPHLHFEVRPRTNNESDSAHPYHWLPWSDTANFTAPGAPRFNRSPGGIAARLVFGAGSKEEGDLARVEVDLLAGATLLSTRRVEFDDKGTVQEGPGEEFEFTNDIAVEGYQTSNMVQDGWPDLSYGVVVRDLPANCDGVVARVIDLGGRTATGGPVAVPAQPAFDESTGVETGMPPAGWTAVTSSSGAGTTLYATAAAAHDGGLGLDCLDASTSEAVVQRAAVEIPLPPGRFEWTAEGWFNPVSVGMADTDAIYLLEFTSGGVLSSAALLWKSGGSLLATLVGEKPGGSLAGTNDSAPVAVGQWRHWRLSLLRNGTRETTAVLYLDAIERGRLTWSSTAYEPDALRAGIGLSSTGVTAHVYADGLHVTERHAPPFPAMTAPSSTRAEPGPGDSLAGVEVDPVVVGAGGASCVTITRLPTDATVTVLTPSGRRVRAFGEGEIAGGTASWCLADSSGKPVARGVYLLLLRDRDGGRRVLKVVVKK